MNPKQIITTQLEQAFRRKSWHGTNLMGSIRSVDVEAASWRPGPGRHNIWELIVHCAYWKYSVYRRLVGDPKPSFALKGSNWFPRPEATTESALKADIKLLKDYHELLLESFELFPEACLGDIPKGSSTPFIDLIVGVAAHDLYHAGQIQLIKRLKGN